MKKLLCLLTVLLSLPAPAQGDRSEELYTAILGVNSSLTKEVDFLKKTTRFQIPDACWPMMLETGPYAGATSARNFATTMVKYFAANPSVDASKFSFVLAYEGPADKASWKNYINYWGQLYNSQELFDQGWVPKSGECHLTLTVTPKASGFSATGDGKKFAITAPASEIPTSQWAKSVRPLFAKYGSPGARP